MVDDSADAPQTGFVDLDFAIVCHQRSGSHLLQTCLHSHPDIYCYGELVNTKNVERPRDTSLVGGIIMYNQWDRIGDGISVDKFLHLTRDSRSTARSVARNAKDKEVRAEQHRAHYRDGDERPPLYEVSEEELARWIARIQGLRSKFESLLSDRMALTVRYENLTRDRSIQRLPTGEAARILEFLDVDYAPLSTSLIKVGPSGAQG